MAIDTVDAALLRLRNQAKEFAEFKRAVPKTKEQRFLVLAIKAWVRIISQRAISIALLLETSDLASALILIRTLREKSTDLILLCSWDQLEEAALRAHIYPRDYNIGGSQRKIPILVQTQRSKTWNPISANSRMHLDCTARAVGHPSGAARAARQVRRRRHTQLRGAGRACQGRGQF